SESKEERKLLINNIYKEIKEISKKRKVKYETKNILDQSEYKFDKDIIQTLEKTSEDMGIPYTKLSSMAGHDAAHMSEITKTAMLFVKSINGISHSPDEYTREEDIEIAANVMLQTVLNLDKTL